MIYKAVQYNKEIDLKKNGGQLTDVETASEQSVIPDGALHKNKHHLDLDNITLKGIPVLQGLDDSVETFEQIKSREMEIQQSAEVEALEIIFSKELTDFIETKRKEWHDTNSNEILEEVGKRVTKELLENTKDTTGLIATIERKV